MATITGKVGARLDDTLSAAQEVVAQLPKMDAHKARKTVPRLPCSPLSPLAPIRVGREPAAALPHAAPAVPPPAMTYVVVVARSVELLHWLDGRLPVCSATVCRDRAMSALFDL